ncbi:MAG: hypothetical protein U0637_13990 [Phycisphaerales bacterium]
MTKPLIEAPASTDSQIIEPLASLDAYDAVLNDDYAFVAYKETDRSSGAWRVRVKARHLTGVVFEPDAMRSQARATSAQGKPFFTWGNGIDPSAGDPRSVQYRVHVAAGQPAKVELFVQTRKADHTAGDAKSTTFAWPA